MVHFGQVRDLARKQLVELLDQYSGSKVSTMAQCWTSTEPVQLFCYQVLVWDEGLLGPVDTLADAAFLRTRGVTRMLKQGLLLASSSALAAKEENVVFIVRPEVRLMDAVAEVIQRFEDGQAGQYRRPEFHAVFVPKRSFLCERRLKDAGVFGSLTFVDEWPQYWFPLDDDLLTMDRPALYRDFHLNGDPTSLHAVAQGLVHLQALYGVIPSVYGKGRAAKQIFDFMSQLRKEAAGSGCAPKMTPGVDTLLILDRQVDLVSPLVTQLTYEGLIDELFGITHCVARFPAAKFEAASQNEEDDEATEEDSLSSAASQQRQYGKQFHLSSKVA